jgi:CitMHS family citrate-Mg2+:H+ or citrate-Ca2+:H+ symporter
MLSVSDRRMASVRSVCQPCQVQGPVSATPRNEGTSLGVPAVQVGQAAVLGQMTTGFPVSPLTPATFLLVGLAGIEVGEHQRFSIPYLFSASVVMTITAVLFHIFPL